MAPPASCAALAWETFQMCSGSCMYHSWVPGGRNLRVSVCQASHTVRISRYPVANVGSAKQQRTFSKKKQEDQGKAGSRVPNTCVSHVAKK